MFRRISIIASFLLIVSAELYGQNDGFMIDRTEPQEGSTSVELESVISLYFNRELELNTNFIQKTFIEPRNGYSLAPASGEGEWTVILDEDDDGNITVTRYRLIHKPDTDFIWIVYGVKSGDGRITDRPYVLNYTTASSSGLFEVSGNVDVGYRTLPVTKTGETRLENIDLVLFEYKATDVRDNLALVEELATREGPAQQLIGIEATNVGVVPPTARGRAYHWTYDYYSPETGDVTRVEVDPIAIHVSAFSASDDEEARVPVPAAFTTSADALAAAEAAGGEAFRDDNADKHIRILLRGGDLQVDGRPEAEGPYWMVTYVVSGANGTAEDVRSYFLDMETGEELPAGPPPDVQQDAFAVSSTRGVDREEGAWSMSLVARVSHAAGRSPETQAVTRYRPPTPRRLSSGHSLDNVVVLLLDEFESDRTRWRVRAGAVADENSGSFEFRSVREGTHWPLAIQFAEGDPSTIIAYGIHDPSGDYQPESITLTDYEPTYIDDEQPRLTQLAHIYPNPASERAVIRFLVSEADRVTVEAFNVLGHRIATLFDGLASQGLQEVSWHLSDVAPGVYFIRLTSGDTRIFARLVVTR